MADIAVRNDFNAAPAFHEQAHQHRMQALGLLAVHDTIGERDIIWYRAADPGYPGNFTRDSLTTAFLLGDRELLEHQLLYSAYHQGTKYDAQTGEEPGKIHHELVQQDDGGVGGIQMEGLSTAYNACDTTAQFLLGISKLAELDGRHVFDNYSGNIAAAIGYIQAHVRNNLFYEMPLHGEQNLTFGLKVTYWKDSRLNLPDKAEPSYPIVYALAHFQNAEALRKIGRAMGNLDLLRLGNEMTKTGIDALWQGDHFAVAIDGEGEDATVIDSPSSDSLHALLYIPPALLPGGYAEMVEEYAVALETDAGYRTGLPLQPEDDYHTDYVWTHEQALLHAAAQRHGLRHAMQITERIISHFNGAHPELVHAHTFEPGKNKVQLWAIATDAYMQHRTSFFDD